MSLKIAEAFVEITARNNTEPGTNATKAFMARKGEEIVRAFMTPMEKMKAGMRGLLDLHSGGHIDDKTYGRGMKAVAAEYNEATGATARFAERQARAAQAFESSRTALEKYLTRLSELKNQKAKGDIDADVYGRQVSSAKATYQNSVGITQQRAAAQAHLNSLIAAGTTPAERFAADMQILDAAMAKGVITQQQYANAAKMVQQNLKAGVGGGRAGGAGLAAAYGIADAVAVFENTGFKGALMASANNMQQVMALAFGSGTAAIGVMGVALGSILIPKLLDALSGTRSLKDEVIDFTSAVEDMAATFKAIDLQTEIEFSRESLSKATSEALKDKENVELEKKTAAERKIEAAEREASNTEDDVQKYMEQVVDEKYEKNSRPSTGETYETSEDEVRSAMDEIREEVKNSQRIKDFVAMDKESFDVAMGKGELTEAEANLVISLRHRDEVEKKLAEEREKGIAAEQRLAAVREFKPMAVSRDIEKQQEQIDKDNRRYSERKQKEQEQRDKSATSLSRALGMETAGSPIAKALAGIENQARERDDLISQLFPQGGAEAERLRAQNIKSAEMQAKDATAKKDKPGQFVGIEGLAKQIQQSAVNSKADKAAEETAKATKAAELHLKDMLEEMKKPKPATFG